MSLENDGFWKAGFWSTTFWADGFWYEGAPPEPPAEPTINGTGGTPRRVRFRNEAYKPAPKKYKFIPPKYNRVYSRRELWLMSLKKEYEDKKAEKEALVEVVKDLLSDKPITKKDREDQYIRSKLDEVADLQRQLDALRKKL